MINFRIKYKILLYIQQFKALSFFKNTKIDNTRRQAYIFLAADYGNLGDVAITYAQTKFLEKNSNYQVIEIPISQSLEGFWFVRKHIKASDLITTVGGGNMGERYDQIEFIRQLVFKVFPNNKIISFPQTFDFSNTKEGIKALKKAEAIYNSHTNLVLVARERLSYELMSKHFTKAKILLTPDIVLSLEMTKTSSKRDGIVFCMRNDDEKSLTTSENKSIRAIVRNYFSQVEDYDTHININKLSVAERSRELNKIWNKFKSAELVITDRLHGMIFCYITNTPCLVFQNNNHKVKETCKWFGEYPQVHLIQNYSDESLHDYLKSQVWLNTFTHIDLSKNHASLRNEL